MIEAIICAHCKSNHGECIIVKQLKSASVYWWQESEIAKSFHLAPLFIDGELFRIQIIFSVMLKALHYWLSLAYNRHIMISTEIQFPLGLYICSVFVLTRLYWFGQNCNNKKKTDSPAWQKLSVQTVGGRKYRWLDEPSITVRPMNQTQVSRRAQTSHPSRKASSFSEEILFSCDIYDATLPSSAAAVVVFSHTLCLAFNRSCSC